MASDGLRARDNGRWGREKLAFVDSFAPPAFSATERKHQRWYLDLFAGPGMNVERGTGKEFRGSPLRVLHLTAEGRPDLHFTHAVFVNESKLDHAALQERIERAYAVGGSVIPRENVTLMKADANEALPEIMSRIDHRAYVFAFADIEAPKQWPWQTVRELRRQRHASVDLYALFPLDMAIVRLCAYEARHRERLGMRLTEFFGTDEWRRFAAAARTEKQSAQLRADLTELYLRQLRTLWRSAGIAKDVRRTRWHALYKMVFASDHPAGSRIAAWARQQGNAEHPQLRLGL